jgi:hypothetical protein
MKPSSLRAAAGLTGLVLLLAGCTHDSSDPAGPNLAASVVISSEVVEADFAFNPRGCAPEVIAFHFRTAFRFQSVVANDRRFITNVTIVERGSSGVGVETGTLYRLAGGSRDRFSTGENGAATFIAFQRFVSQGAGGNFAFRVQLHFTMTPDGEIVTDIDRTDVEC